ncbi:MAG: hypothetical protein AB1765_01625 [Candidatus Hydrogenedentota bacterium]
MVASINGIAQNRMYFKLDPGEPGMLRSSTPSQSTLQVTAQERRNINRLKADAMEQGGQVIQAQIKYNRGIENGIPVTRGGQTTVRSVNTSTSTAGVILVGLNIDTYA